MTCSKPAQNPVMSKQKQRVSSFAQKLGSNGRQDESLRASRIWKREKRESKEINGLRFGSLLKTLLKTCSKPLRHLLKTCPAQNPYYVGGCFEHGSRLRKT
jgi:hypothetical protein